MKKEPEIVSQRVLSDFKQTVVILFMIIQLVSMLVLVASHLVQTEVIADEIYSVLFQRILVVLLELIKLVLL